MAGASGVLALGFLVGEPDLVQQQVDAAHEVGGRRIDPGVGRVGECVAQTDAGRAARVLLAPRGQPEGPDLERAGAIGDDLHRHRPARELDREEGRRDQSVECLGAEVGERRRRRVDAQRQLARDAGQERQPHHVVEMVVGEQDLEPFDARDGGTYRRLAEARGAGAGVEQQRAALAQHEEAHRPPPSARNVAVGAERQQPESAGHAQPRASEGAACQRRSGVSSPEDSRRRICASRLTRGPSNASRSKPTAR
jgi:hypothetical protein